MAANALPRRALSYAVICVRSGFTVEKIRWRDVAVPKFTGSRLIFLIFRPEKTYNRRSFYGREPDAVARPS